MFGLLLWSFLIFGLMTAALGHAGFYRMVFREGRGTNDHEDSFGSF